MSGSIRSYAADCLDLQPGGFHSSPALAKDHLVVGTESGRVYFLPISDLNLEVVKPVWVFSTQGTGRDANRAVSSSPAVSDGNVYFGGEDGILYGLGNGTEVAVVDLLKKPKATTAVDATRKLEGSQWHTAAGDMGYSGVSPDTTIRPPFRIKWRTRIWSTCKSGVIVADGKVFAAGRMGQLTALDAETGDIVWQRRYDNLIPNEKVTPIRHASALGEGKLFFSVADSETLSRKRHIERLFGATIAVDPDGGDLIWSNTDFRLVRGSRASYRNGTFVVFSPDGAHALNAKTGKHLWSSPPPKKLHFGHYYMNALTDEFLESKGQRGLFGYIPCSYPIYVNGLWYGHTGSGTPHLAAWTETPAEQQGQKGKYERKVVWRHQFLSRACPSPAPAYGRLYYAPNGEGVVYCFGNDWRMAFLRRTSLMKATKSLTFGLAVSHGGDKVFVT
jgi:outer membrane protein assembly factor BamB